MLCDNITLLPLLVNCSHSMHPNELEKWSRCPHIHPLCLPVSLLMENFKGWGVKYIVGGAGVSLLWEYVFTES